MASESLYRKYRPHTFADVEGQEHITSVLEGAIEKGQVAHAYLFAGSRGLGKTSIARIFARTLGCSDKDVIEMDAASHTGVDNIRELSENVYTLPFESPYKVYIIDEAHMLSKSAWNAFLKTLEEPPSHVIFILATTELEKVPDTIISRCQSFSFRAPGSALLSKVVRGVAKKEGYALSEDSAELVALLAEGSYRDALSILQKVIIASADKKIEVAEVESITGAPRAALIRTIVEGIHKKDMDAVLASLNEASDTGVSARLLLTLLLARLRAILLVRHSTRLKEEIKKSQVMSTSGWKQLLGKTFLVFRSSLLLRFLNLSVLLDTPHFLCFLLNLLFFAPSLTQSKMLWSISRVEKRVKQRDTWKKRRSLLERHSVCALDVEP